MLFSDLPGGTVDAVGNQVKVDICTGHQSKTGMGGHRNTNQLCSLFLTSFRHVPCFHVKNAKPGTSKRTELCCRVPLPLPSLCKVSGHCR